MRIAAIYTGKIVRGSLYNNLHKMRVSMLFDCFVDTLVDFETRRVRMKIIIFRDSRYKICRQVRREQYLLRLYMYLLNFNKNNTFIIILFLMFFNYYYCY
jgi:hypothetical protein